MIPTQILNPNDFFTIYYSMSLMFYTALKYHFYHYTNPSTIFKLYLNTPHTILIN